MSTFDPVKHPRRTDGKFAPKPSGAAGEADGLDLDPVEPPARSWRTDRFADALDRLDGGSLLSGARSVMVASDGQRWRPVSIELGDGTLLRTGGDGHLSDDQVDYPTDDADLDMFRADATVPTGWEDFAHRAGGRSEKGRHVIVDLDLARDRIDTSARWGQVTDAERDEIGGWLSGATPTEWDEKFDADGPAGAQVADVAEVIGRAGRIEAEQDGEGAWEFTDTSSGRRALVSSADLMPEPWPDQTPVVGQERARAIAARIAGTLRG